MSWVRAAWPADCASPSMLTVIRMLGAVVPIVVLDPVAVASQRASTLGASAVPWEVQPPLAAAGQTASISVAEAAP